MNNDTSVIIYSTDTCPYCEMAKRFFESKGVTYTNKNVGIDRVAATEMITKSGQTGVPVIEINGEVVVGFRPDVFEKLLG